ncbi:MAG TPA: hypothetical protein VNI57_07700 [Candidatus Saccharimonadales bacterium]|nr:hypothetical protein [Candidatus Saccharimonadales bacterium]
MPESRDVPDPQQGASVRVRRTRILSRPADQFRTSLVPTAAAAVMLVLLLAAVHGLNEGAAQQLAATNPALQEVLASQSKGMDATLATGAIFYLLGILGVGLVHSRRLMGALFAIHRRVRMLGEGDLVTPFRLRRGDYFHDVADSIRETISTLRMQAREDLADVQDLMSILDRSPYAGPLREGLRGTLEQMALRKRSLLGIQDEVPREAEAPVLAFPG